MCRANLQCFLYIRLFRKSSNCWNIVSWTLKWRWRSVEGVNCVLLVSADLHWRSGAVTSWKSHWAIRKVAGSPHQLMLPFVTSFQQEAEYTPNSHQMAATDLLGPVHKVRVILMWCARFFSKFLHFHYESCVYNYIVSSLKMLFYEKRKPNPSTGVPLSTWRLFILKGRRLSGMLSVSG